MVSKIDLKLRPPISPSLLKRRVGMSSIFSLSLISKKVGVEKNYFCE